MATTQTLVGEVTDTAEFLRNRNNIADTGEKAVLLRKNLAQSMAVSVASLSVLTAKDASAFTTALLGDPYGEFTALVRSAVDSRLQSTCVDHTRAVVSPKGSTITSVHRYPHNALPDATWTVIRNPKVPPYSKMSMLVHQMGLLGIANAHEQTFRWWVALYVLCAYNKPPHPDDIHRDLLSMKLALLNQRLHVPFAPLAEYPEHASDLPDSIRAFAYTDDAPAVNMHVEQLKDVALNHVPLRGNSKLLSAGYRRSLQLQVKGELKTEPSPIKQEVAQSNAWGLAQPVSPVRDSPRALHRSPPQLQSRVCVHAPPHMHTHTVKEEKEERIVLADGLELHIPIKKEHHMDDPDAASGVSPAPIPPKQPFGLVVGAVRGRSLEVAPQPAPLDAHAGHIAAPCRSDRR